MFQEIPVSEGNIYAVKATGKLTDADYRDFLPRIEKVIRQQGRISLYLELEGFEGWEPRAAWDDMRFGMEYVQSFERIAIVGEKRWESWMTALFKLLMPTEVRYFHSDQSQDAWDWLRGTTDSEGGQRPYRHVLVATDFSAISRKALGRGSELAQRYGARLSLIHVMEELIFYDEFYDPITPDRLELDEQLRNLAEQRLRQLAEELGVQDQASIELTVGTPRRGILEYAGRHAVDLIVLGSQGRHGIDRLLGSVARGVLHKAACDVLTVRA